MPRRSLILNALLAATMSLGINACNHGEINNMLPDPGSSITVPPCTDALSCCSPEELRCEGNPDGVVICTCDALWDCSKNPDKCEKTLPMPGGGNSWDCTWTEFAYTCKASGSQDQPPVGGGDWNCSYDEQSGQWVCTEPPPNPTNITGNSDWRCEVDAEGNLLVCYPIVPDGSTTTTPPPPPPPPVGTAGWSCEENANGLQECTKDGGIPDGGGDWQCHLMVETNTWICVGTSVPGAPDGSGDWNCDQSELNGVQVWICRKPNEPGEDTPDGGGDWACTKDSEFGTICEETDGPPEPPGMTAKSGDEACIPGTKRWCDGLDYCGWGQMTCNPDGTWPTKRLSNGKLVYDCRELSDGARPNTQCACYFFFYNGSCCERPDCIIPDDYTPQICPKSNGGLCDYCNPQTPECKTSGSMCLVTSQGESFCGQECSALKPCPTGYACHGTSTSVGTRYQCVPADQSCYF
ncbi:MAG: hypothetical protein JRH20_10505 [Deltaproteobacteria bacterium]|nr:hypothetical protein [Deltaproteobacteria bacterium]